MTQKVRPGTIPGKSKLTAYMDERVHRALRLRSADTGESMSDITERALRRELGMVETWQAWIGSDLMGEGATREAAIEAAVAEYERMIGYGDEPHLYADRDALIAALDIGVKEG